MRGHKPTRGMDLFPEETAKIAALLSIERRAIALTCTMLGLGIDNKQMAELRGVSVKTVEAEVQQSLLIVQGCLKIGFTPNAKQLVLISHDLIEGRHPQPVLLNGQRPQNLEVGGLVSLYNLSLREAEVSALKAMGYRNSEVANMLGISVKIVEAHKTKAEVKIKKALKLDKPPKSRRFAIIVHDMMANRLPRGMNLHGEPNGDEQGSKPRSFIT